jgi:O-acetylhomoserine (thiol)-lyase
MRPATQCIHAGQHPDAATRSRAVPIFHPESSLSWLEAADPVDDGTVRVFEERIRILEGGGDAIAFASGQAAITAALLATCAAGDHLVSSLHVWGGARNLFNIEATRWNIPTTYISSDDPADFRAAIRPNTRLIYGESISNPLLRIFPFREIAEIGRETGIPTAVDNTTFSPILCRPIEHGIDMVVHSTTKYLSSHGTSVGGIVVTRPGADRLALRLRSIREEIGGQLSAINAFLGLQGMATLHLRMVAHNRNTLTVARFLERHPRVDSVCYPGLESHPSHALAKRYSPEGCSGLLGVIVKGGRAGAKRFVESLHMFSHLANIGDTRSLALHPASSTVFGATDEQLIAAGLHPGFVRLSIGIESIDDILDDLDQALLKIQI